MGVVSFEMDGDALSVTGVERAILCLVSIPSRREIGSGSAGGKELDPWSKGDYGGGNE